MQNHSNETSGIVSVNDKYEFAGFWVRLAAYTIDTAVITVGLLAVRLVFIGINSLIAGSVLEGGILFHYTLKDIVLYLLQVLYFILFTYHTGTTPGKKALNLRVVRADDERLTLLTVIYRETIGRFLCGFILFVGYLLIGVDKEKRGLHDILCDTRVIYAKKVKVYPQYLGRIVSSETKTPEKTEVSVEENSMNKENAGLDYVPRMVDESASEENQNTIQDDIQAQWNRILNPQKEEITPSCEEQNIEGNP